MKTEIQEKLTELAYKCTTRYCLSCHAVAKKGRCPCCHSDDLAYYHEESGSVDWGISWVIPLILEEKFHPVDVDGSFEDFVRSCYEEEVTVGWAKFDTVEILKSQDPISWRCAQSDWESQEEEEGNIISFDGGSTYYWTHEVENLIDRE